MSRKDSAREESPRDLVRTFCDEACDAFLTTRLSSDEACSVQETVTREEEEDGSCKLEVELLFRFVKTEEDIVPFPLELPGVVEDDAAAAVDEDDDDVREDEGPDLLSDTSVVVAASFKSNFPSAPIR